MSDTNFSDPSYHPSDGEASESNSFPSDELLPKTEDTDEESDDNSSSTGSVEFIRVASKFEFCGAKIEAKLKKFLKNGTGPYKYQIEAVLKTKELIRKDEIQIKPVLIVAPTGSGKTGMAVLLPYVLKSQKVLILTPSTIISEQIGIAFGTEGGRKCFFEECKFFGNCRRRTLEKNLEAILEPARVIRNTLEIQGRLGNLVIINAQKFGGQSRLSLTNKNETIVENAKKFFKQFDTLIVDEAHHYPAKTWENIVETFGVRVPGLAKKIIFLTATPYKMVGGQEMFILGSGYEPHQRIAYQITREDVQGVSTRPCDFFEPCHDASPQYVLKDLYELFRMNRQAEPRFINPQAMILVRLVSEAREWVQQLNELSGRTNFAISISGQGAAEALERFTNGEFRVAITCGVAKEGYDNPNVLVCVVLRKIGTGRLLFEQFCGRCRRIKRDLGGGGHDRSMAAVLSYPEFQQGRLWKQIDKLAERDPVEVDEEEEDE